MTFRSKFFLFFHEYGEGSCSDIIGHEFTHCLTNTAQHNNLYQNDSGAINEALSDIMGNLIEMSFGDSPGGEWLVGEKEKNGTIRSMKDPHQFRQPEYIWDQYYVPNVLASTDSNDSGGVHINSSLLNFVSYKLNQAGMPLEDQIYFWLNADLSMTPTTDYPTLVKLLPWCLEITGYSEYKEALNRAIEEGKLGDIYLPDTAPEDKALLRFALPESLDLSQYEVVAGIQKVGSEYTSVTWPAGSTSEIAGVYDEGDYIIMLAVSEQGKAESICNLYLTQDGWKVSDESLEESIQTADFREHEELLIHLENGKVFTPETDSLEELINAALNQ